MFYFDTPSSHKFILTSTGCSARRIHAPSSRTRVHLMKMNFVENIFNLFKGRPKKIDVNRTKNSLPCIFKVRITTVRGALKRVGKQIYQACSREGTWFATNVLDG